MRTLLRILALVPLVLPSVGPATSGAATISPSSDVVSALSGHWRCTSSAGATSRRSYVVLSGASAARGTSSTRAAGGTRAGGAGLASSSVGRTVYARQDNGSDAAPAFERVSQNADGSLAVDAPEGAGTAPAGATSFLRFAGQTAVPARAIATSEEAVGAASIHRADSTPSGRWISNAPISGRAPQPGSAPRAEQSVFTARPLALTYSLEGGAMRRVATAGYTTISDEQCYRDTASVATSNCARSNAPASTIHAVAPVSAQRAPAAVQLHLVLDDRAQVVGADVMSSPSAGLNASALMAARDSRFAAEVRGCRAVSSEYAFTVHFSALGADALHRASNNGRETNL